MIVEWQKLIDESRWQPCAAFAIFLAMTLPQELLLNIAACLTSFRFIKSLMVWMRAKAQPLQIKFGWAWSFFHRSKHGYPFGSFNTNRRPMNVLFFCHVVSVNPFNTVINVYWLPVSQFACFSVPQREIVARWQTDTLWCSCHLVVSIPMKNGKRIVVALNTTDAK